MASTPFRILIGEHADSSKEFVIHSALLAPQSDSLDILVNGKMKEAQEKCVVWDIDERTFVQFSQFVYTGDYDASDAEEPDVKTSHQPEIVAQALAHARLIVFADYHGLKTLCDLSITKLTAALDKLLPTDTPASIRLLQFCYEEDTPECLRTVVMTHIMKDATTLWNHNHFREFVETWPELAVRFLKAVMPLYGKAIARR